MKKLFRRWIIFTSLLNGTLAIAQVVVFALFFALSAWTKLHENVGSRIFFAIMVIWLIYEFVIGRVLGLKSRRVLNKNRIWENELRIGYDVMEQDDKVLDEKTGYLKFLSWIKYWLLISNGINILIALVFAIILEVG